MFNDLDTCINIYILYLDDFSFRYADICVIFLGSYPTFSTQYPTLMMDTAIHSLPVVLCKNPYAMFFKNDPLGNLK